MSFIGRARTMLASLVDVYRSWRLVPAVLILLGGIGAAIVLAGPDRALVAAAATLVPLGAASVLFAVEVARQDRLRATAARTTRPATSAMVDVEATTSTPIRVEVPTTVNPEPPVSIVVTAHNEAAFIEDCLRSIAEQTWHDFECIVIDDLSTDSTLQRAAAVVHDDPRFRLVHLTANRGLAGARNVGTAHARGRLITFVDGDDHLYSDAIAGRIETIAESPDEDWVVGAYCLWHSVAELEPRSLTPPEVPIRDRVTWVDALESAPFIASAPLLRTQAVRAVGGFDESLTTAEDFEFWSRVLRQGWVLEASPVVGIAYRQKRRSMFRTTGRQHAATTVDVHAANQQPVGTDVAAVGPQLFRRPGHEHRLELARFRRALIAFVSAVADDAPTDWAPPHEPWMLRALDVDREVRRAVVRHEGYRREGQQARIAELTARVWRQLGPHLGINPALRMSTSTSSQGAPVVAEHAAPGRELGPVRPVPVSGSSPGRPHVLLGPASAYHVDEMGPLAVELRERGHPVGFLLSDGRVDAVAHELRKYSSFPVWTYDRTDPAVGPVRSACSAFLVLNDWGEDRAIIDDLRAHDVPTFAKVEGVQDFQDDDVHWQRGAYTHAEHTLCQGPNDLANTSGPRHVVGSTRLERIWNEPVRRPADELVVINLNFTYGVLAEARDGWLASVLEACQAEGVPYTISRHPAERSPIDDPNIAEEPMRHLLTRATLLISRFSTVPFEAMARGVPFAYHNPHGEKVPTFHEPAGAFPVTHDADELRAAIRWSRDHQDDYRSVARDFFLAQVDIDPTRSSEERTADVLIDVLGH